MEVTNKGTRPVIARVFDAIGNWYGYRILWVSPTPVALQLVQESLKPVGKSFVEVGGGSLTDPAAVKQHAENVMAAYHLLNSFEHHNPQGIFEAIFETPDEVNPYEVRMQPITGERLIRVPHRIDVRQQGTGISGKPKFTAGLRGTFKRGAGDNPHDAVGNLVWTNTGEFNIHIDHRKEFMGKG